MSKLTESPKREQTSGADGVKIAVLREGRARLILFWAAAHFKRYTGR
jgi:hypothetical protein